MSLRRRLKMFAADELQRCRAAGAPVGNWCNARPHPSLLPRGEGESFAGFWECRAAELAGGVSSIQETRKGMTSPWGEETGEGGRDTNLPERDLQVASTCEVVRCGRIRARASVRAMKRRERRAPIPKGVRHSAQGCEERATLGIRWRKFSTPTGLWQTSRAMPETKGPQPRWGWWRFRW